MSGIPLSMDADMVRDHIRGKIKAMGMSCREYADMCGYDPRPASFRPRYFDFDLE